MVPETCFRETVLVGYGITEAVALMESLGVMLGISTAVLGLTVLALGNSIGDLIADMAVARNGQVG